jgi:hypothetical protein
MRVSDEHESHVRPQHLLPPAPQAFSHAPRREDACASQQHTWVRGVLFHLTSSSAGRWPWFSEKRSSVRLSDLNVSVFNVLVSAIAPTTR